MSLNAGNEFLGVEFAIARISLEEYGHHTTLKASQIVAGGRSEASTPGSKNAPTQSILKGCQIVSYRMDSQHQECVTQDFTHLGFEGNQSRTTFLDCVLAVRSRFLASLQDAFANSIPFRGFPLRYNPRLRSAIASRSRLQAKPHNFTNKYRYPR